jgi:hypothetical protein
MQWVKATLVIHSKQTWPDGTLVQWVVWRLPAPVAGCGHPFKYRLYCGRGGRCLVRYDNEAGKGDHRHLGEGETSYAFTTLAALLADFRADVRRLAGGGYG